MELNSQSDQQQRSPVESLVRRAQQGDVGAFGELVKQYQKQVRIYVVSLTGSSSADEIAQEVFLAAFQSIHRFEGGSQFSTWLMGIARNKAISAIRARLARVRRERAAGLERWQQWEAQRIQDTSHPQTEEQLESLRHCLRRLKPEHRELLERHYRDDESAESIAQSTGRGGSAVRMLFLRLRKSLSECMQRHQKPDPHKLKGTKT